MRNIFPFAVFFIFGCSHFLTHPPGVLLLHLLHWLANIAELSPKTISPTGKSWLFSTFLRGEDPQLCLLVQRSLMNTFWLVVSIPLKKTKVSWDDDIPNWMESHKNSRSKPPTSSWILVTLHRIWAPPCSNIQSKIHHPVPPTSSNISRV